MSSNDLISRLIRDDNALADADFKHQVKMALYVAQKKERSMTLRLLIAVVLRMLLSDGHE